MRPVGVLIESTHRDAILTRRALALVGGTWVWLGMIYGPGPRMDSDNFVQKTRRRDWRANTAEIPCGQLVCEVYESKLPCLRATD